MLISNWLESHVADVGVSSCSLELMDSRWGLLLHMSWTIMWCVVEDLHFLHWWTELLFWYDQPGATWRSAAAVSPSAVHPAETSPSPFSPRPDVVCCPAGIVIITMDESWWRSCRPEEETQLVCCYSCISEILCRFSTSCKMHLFSNKNTHLVSWMVWWKQQPCSASSPHSL